VRKLFDSIAGQDLVSRRDRAILGVKLLEFFRIGAMVRMRDTPPGVRGITIHTPSI